MNTTQHIAQTSKLTPYTVSVKQLLCSKSKPTSAVLNWSGKCVPRQWIGHPSTPLFSTAVHSESDADRLICGDNLPILVDLLTTHRESIDLIYIDPPFDSKSNYSKKVRLKGAQTQVLDLQQVQYQDRWSGDSYLQFMFERLMVLHELLNQHGSIIIHCDRHRAHHLRCIADEVFGRDQFRGSMAWCYGGGGAPKRQYPAKHDTLLWFSKSDAWTFNKQFRPYSKSTLARGLTKVKGPKYALNEHGAMLNDWWADDAVQKILSPTAFENLKYPTQKPEALLERIIVGHSNPGDIILDCFTGSGTSLAVARKHARRYIGIDQNTGAIATTIHRLLNQNSAQSEADCDSPLPGFSVHYTQAQIQTMSQQEACIEFTVTREPPHLNIDCFNPVELLSMIRDAGGETHDFRNYIESVLIDPQFDGAVFRPTIIDIATRNRLINGHYHLPPATTWIRIWVTDILSNVYCKTVKTEALQP